MHAKHLLRGLVISLELFKQSEIILVQTNKYKNIWKVIFWWCVVLALENDLSPIQRCNNCFGNSSSKCSTQQGVQYVPSGPQVLFGYIDTFRRHFYMWRRYKLTTKISSQPDTGLLFNKWTEKECWIMYLLLCWSLIAKNVISLSEQTLLYLSLSKVIATVQ